LIKKAKKHLRLERKEEWKVLTRTTKVTKAMTLVHENKGRLELAMLKE
jgi:hypothetical protein